MKHLSRWFLSLLALSLSAAVASAVPGRAEVKKVTGRASVSNSAGTRSVVVGMELRSGDTITTERGSTVDLWLGLNGDALRVEPESTLSLDTLEITNPAERTFTTSMSLSKGGVVGNVASKISLASKYEVKTTRGVAGIRGTVYSLRTDGTLVVARGTVVFSFVLNGVTQQVTVPQGQQFKPGDAAPTPAPPQVLTTINEAATSLGGNTGVVATDGGSVTVTDNTNPLNVSTSN